MQRAETMFERYGGFARVSRVVSSFYERVLESPSLAPYFAGIDMRRQIDHQTKFIASIRAGPPATPMSTLPGCTRACA